MKLQFMKHRKLSYWISGILVVLSIVSLLFKGLNYGIDFSGGISMEVVPVENYTIDRMRSDLSGFRPELQKMVDTGNILVRVGLPSDSSADARDVLKEDIKNALGSNISKIVKEDVVSGRISDELMRGGIMATIFAFLLMSIYIWIRYKGGYAVGSLVSLVLDFIIMFGFFSVVGLEFNQTAIAVILMGIGYSMNDKVVNYDRIEENAKKYHKMPQDDLIDLSINETMRRTILTSVSTMLCMLGLYFFGGSMLREFAVAMIFCVVMGTLTSIYVSNVVLYHFNIRKD
ncbi:hypothetical protein FACS189421_09380 [Bacteroidia bacterium]|nr:hypothetical protein FACS189421_09380 [Bacteroidia bacterium]